MSRKRCPECQEDMDAKMVPYFDGTNGYVEAWTCPNFDNHGKTVECEHCGEPVKGPNSHYSYTEGLIGSGRWNCFPTERHRKKQKADLDALWDMRIEARKPLGRAGKTSPIILIELPGEIVTDGD